MIIERVTENTEKTLSQCHFYHQSHGICSGISAPSCLIGKVKVHPRKSHENPEGSRGIEVNFL
jgi:hypothetical protein